MDEQKSGLVAESSFEKMQQEAFKFFMGFVRNIGESEYRVTLKTAFDLATKMTVGIVQPIFDKLDPITIGEDYRSNRLALAYAERLNSHSNNLRRTHDFNALENLLSGYPAHGFVIDVKEAGSLFKRVKPLPKEMNCIWRALGVDAIIPRNRRNEQTPRVEFLNDEKARPERTEEPSARTSAATNGNGPGRNPARRDRASKLPRDTPKRSNAKPPNGQAKGTRQNGGSRL